jgi:hypothetical protein
VKPSFSIFVYSTNWVPTNKLYGLKSLFKIDIIIYQFIYYMNLVTEDKNTIYGPKCSCGRVAHSRLFFLYFQHTWLKK